MRLAGAEWLLLLMMSLASQSVSDSEDGEACLFRVSMEQPMPMVGFLTQKTLFFCLFDSSFCGGVQYTTRVDIPYHTTIAVSMSLKLRKAETHL